MSLTPFDFVNAINNKTDYLLNDETDKQYVPFVINKAFSYYPDTILIANEMNLRHWATNRMQYDFYMGVVKKGKRFSKWDKTIKIDDLEAVMTYFNYSKKKAIEALKLLSKDQLDRIKKVFKGTAST